MDRLKILLGSSPFFTVPPKNYGGLEAVVGNLFQGLVKLGHKVILYAPRGSLIPPRGFLYESGEPIDTVQVDWMKAEEDMYNDKFFQLLNEVDIASCHNWFGMEYKAKQKGISTKITHTMHGHINTEWWCKTKPPFKLNFITLSKFMQVAAKNVGIESQYCYNGIDLDKYPYQEEKGDRLLFVGRLDSFKRPHIVIEIAKKMDLGLDIVGGSFVADVQYMNSIKQACDGSQIILHLDATQEEKTKLYQNAKAVIFPSKMGEPFGLITVEANSCGTCVISSKDGAIPEIIEEEVTGFTCDTVDEMCLAVKKVNLIKPENCRKRVEQYFSREIMAQNYERLYREILEEREW